MEQMDNKLTLSSEEENSDDIEEMDNNALIIVDDKGKRAMEIIENNASERKAKKPKLVKEPFLQVVEHLTPNMIVDEGKTIDTGNSIVEHYNYLNVQARKEREIVGDKLRSTQPSHFISALDKKRHLMKIIVIQPPLIGDPQGKKTTEFKLNMSQFSIVDKVDLFKKTNELICSDLIITFVSKEKIQRDFRKLENKLKTKQVQKKTLQIKKTELEKKTVEMNKETGNNTLNTLMEEKMQKFRI